MSLTEDDLKKIEVFGGEAVEVERSEDQMEADRLIFASTSGDVLVSVNMEDLYQALRKHYGDLQN